MPGPGLPPVPDEIRRLAEARRDARAARDYETADRLKADLDAAGWKVVDAGPTYRLEPLHPLDVVEGRRTRHGWSGSVPSRLGEPAVGLASVVLIATDAPDDLERALAALAGAIDDAVQRIVVANGPTAEQETALTRWEEHWRAEAAGRASDDPDALGLAETGRAPGVAPDPDQTAGAAEVVWLAERQGAAAAWNAGIRRARAGVVVLLDSSVEAIGDIVTPLSRVLADPTVAVAGPWGLESPDQRHFRPVEEPAAAAGADVAAIAGACLAFRREDAAARGPLDERFVSPALLDAWWSLVLRDEGEGQRPRRAVIVDVPAVRHAAAADPVASGEGSAEDPAERRNRYRLIERFGNRDDLAVHGG